MSLLAVTSGSNGSTGSSVGASEGTEFDGVSDYLSRSTDLVGNVDSKTFTFSCWVYRYNTVRLFEFRQTGAIIGYVTLNQYGSSVQDGTVFISFRNSAGVEILAVTSSIRVPNLTTASLLVSVDLANTANRRMVINDLVDASPTWTIYTNDVINFTCDAFSVGAGILGASKIKGRLSHLYLDYTYRDLSIEANRRLFITADGKPTPTATLKALAPILYLPMKDASTAHINEGTGGNFVQNGTLDTASRGANQDNCVASKFDGSADYLSRTSLTGVADGKQFTFSCTFTQSLEVSNIITFSTGNADRFAIYTNDGPARITAYSASGIAICYTNLPSIFINGKQYSIQVSVDLTDTSKRYVYVNGISIISTWTSYTNDNIDFAISTSPQYRIGANVNNPPTVINGSIGELYFDTRYIDLATSNPFWDSVANRPKPVRQVIAETGITPLIAMPIDASNPGKNYGTGGDFTANSAPYVGARGGSEFIARSAKFDGSTGYLEKTGLISTFPNVSIILCACKYDTSLGYFEVIDLSGVTYGGLKITCNATSIGYTITRTNGGSQGYTYSTTTTTWKIVALTVDWTATTNNVKLYVNGANVATQSYDTLGVPTGSSLVRAQIGNDGSMFAFCYFSQTSIDFSQEVNRNKFVDQLGYPKDLKAQIEAGVIPKPLFYLPFDDPTNLGKDASGNNNHFTVNGTVTQGADVNG